MASLSLQAQEDSDTTTTDNVSIEDASYSLGILMSAQLKSQMSANQLDFEQIAQGMKDGMSDEGKMDAQTANDNFMKYIQPLAQAKMAEAKTKADKVQNAYFEEVGQKEGIEKTQSGIHYEVIQEGTGESPSLNSQVKVHYIGTLPNGDVFDSSVQRGEPATFPVNGVIPGWQEVIPMMQVGSKWRVHIPYAMAYGERGAGQDIPPFATLIFEIELLEVVQ